MSAVNSVLHRKEVLILGNSAARNEQNESGASRFQPGPDTIYERVGEGIVLVDTRTNEIYELNRTAARFWELVCAGNDLAATQQRMLQEFDVAKADLSREIEGLLASLENKGLITKVS